VGQDQCPFQLVAPILRQAGDGVPEHNVDRVVFLHFEMGKGQQSLIHDRFDVRMNIPMLGNESNFDPINIECRPSMRYNNKQHFLAPRAS
jgi:hypothetical protein